MGNSFSVTKYGASWLNYFLGGEDTATYTQIAEQESEQQQLLALQGSSTYLAKFLKLDKGVFTREDFERALATKIQEWMDSCEEFEHTEIDFTNLVNVIYARYLLISGHLPVDNFIAKREFLDSDGNAAFTSFWAGYISWFLVNNPHITEEFYFVDAGTGELKYFHIQPTEDGEFECTGQHASRDGKEFIDLLGEGDLGKLETFFRNPEPGNLNMGTHSGKIYIVGTQNLRKFEDEHPVEFINICSTLEQNNITISTVTQEFEGRCEMGAVRNAIQKCDPECLEKFAFTGNFTWGNGSTQGLVANYECGLNTWKTAIKELEATTFRGEGRKTSVVVNDQETLLEMIRVAEEKMNKYFD